MRVSRDFLLKHKDAEITGGGTKETILAEPSVVSPVNNSVLNDTSGTTKITGSDFILFTPAKIPIQSETKAIDEVVCDKETPHHGKSPSN